MSTFNNLRRVLAFATLTALVTAQAPAGYTEGFSTQDNEPHGQQGPCTTGGNVCHAPTPLFPSNAGPAPMPAGVFAAAINPALIGAGSNNCQQCGMCYSIINAGIASPKGPGGPAVQGGVKQIKVVVVNQCMDCSPVQFDINAAPAGWDNPKIWFKQLDPSECGTSPSSGGAAEEGGDAAAAGKDEGKDAASTGGDPAAKSGGDPAAKAGGDSATNAGGYSDPNAGADPKANAGGDSKANAGGDSKANAGGDTNAKASSDSKANTGGNSKANASGNPNTKASSNPNTEAGGDMKANAGGDPNASSGGDSSPVTVQKSKAKANNQPGKDVINTVPGGDPAATVPGTGKQSGGDKAADLAAGGPEKQGGAVGGSTTSPQKQKQKAGTGYPSRLSVAPIGGDPAKDGQPAGTDGEEDECENEDVPGEAVAPASPAAPVDSAKEAPKGRRQLIPRPRSLPLA